MSDVYKLLRPDLTTYGGCQWVVDEEKITDGYGELCGSGWLHAYTHPLLAVLLNPIHANYDPAVLYRAAVRGERREDYGLKVGYTRMTLVEQVPLPTVTQEQRVRFAIVCALTVYRDRSFVAWAEAWVSGKDRSAAAAAAAAEAAAARASLDLIACAQWACSACNDIGAAAKGARG